MDNQKAYIQRLCTSQKSWIYLYIYTEFVLFFFQNIIFNYAKWWFAKTTLKT